MKPSVCVIMSTYNGLTYLEEQIRSIMTQTDVDVTLYIRDDGSPKEETRKSLLEMKEKYPEIILAFEENVGVGNSFMNALYKAPDQCEYYAFADQDDSWLPNKLSEGVSKINGISGMALYCSNQIVTDENLEDRKIRFSSAPEVKYGAVLRGNKASGCTFVFNKQLRDFLSDPKNRPTKELLKERIHDVWVVEVAALFGTIIYDENGYILYRQHGNNVVGAMDYSLGKKIRVKFHNLFAKSNSGQILAEECLRLWSEGGSLGDKEQYIRAYAKYKKKWHDKRFVLKQKSTFKRDDESGFEYFTKTMLNRL